LISQLVAHLPTAIGGNSVYYYYTNRSPLRTVTGGEMAYRYPEQYDSPRAVAKNGVQRLFHRVVRPVRFVEHYSVQLDPNANGANYQSPSVNDRLYQGKAKT